METPTVEENEDYEKSFIEVPAILDKHKAAAVICDGKLSPSITLHFIITETFK